MSYEQILVTSEPDHQVARAEAGEAAIGDHTYDGRIEVDAGFAVPACMKRRAVCQPMLGDLNRGDLVHGWGTLLPASAVGAEKMATHIEKRHWIAGFAG